MVDLKVSDDARPHRRIPSLRSRCCSLLFAAGRGRQPISWRMIGGPRSCARRRLEAPAAEVERQPLHIGSLRADRVESAWLKLVNGIEQAGLSLVDTKDDAAPPAAGRGGLYRNLCAAGLHAGAYGAGHRAAGAGARAVLWLMGATPVADPALRHCDHCRLARPISSCPVHSRARGLGGSEEIINGFPDALDLMLVCVEAGLGLEAAFARVGKEMTESHPRLAEQLALVVLETARRPQPRGCAAADGRSRRRR